VLFCVGRTNVSVHLDVLLNTSANGSHATGAFVASNVNIGGCWTMYANGVYLWVDVNKRSASLTGNHSQYALSVCNIKVKGITLI